MNKSTFILATVLLILISGCLEPGQTSPDTGKTVNPAKTQDTVNQTGTIAEGSPAQTVSTPLIKTKQDLLIDGISENLTSYYDKKWYNLYQFDELDCSRMSTYFWGYLRSGYHIAPKIIVSYERQHAWLALKVSDVGNSSDYMHWNLKGIDYYYLEATMPRIVVDDNQRFLINGLPYTSAEFYNATIYVFDTPQDANDFHADYSLEGGFNQEFVLKKNDLNKIEAFLK